MSVKISGLVSGLDTDSLVQELVSAYATKKEKYEKAQTKLEWTMDAWKTVNSKVYGFYSSSLSNMRYSSNYSIKSATISSSSVATVSASSDATAGTQSLSVTQLATSGYLTGAKLTATDGSTVKTTTTLSKLGITEGTITVNGTDIDLSSDMTITSLLGKMKSAGVTASFDANSQRLFVSSKSSGADNEFTLTAEDSTGLASLQKLGLFSIKDSDGTETTEMQEYRALADDDYDQSAEVTTRYNAQKYTTDSYTTYITGLVTSATKSQTTAQTKLDTLQADGYDWTTSYDTEDEYNTAISDLETQIAGYASTISTNQALLDDSSALQSAMDTANASILSSITTEVADEVALAKSVVNQVDSGTLSGSSDSVRITAQDAIIKLNGATFTNSTNAFSINGLNITATATTLSSTTNSSGVTTEVDTPVSITTTSDAQGVYDKIVKFFSDYNTMITSVDSLYYADSADGYEPLTDTEKESMTDAQIETWESKVKAALLRKDSTLSDISSSLKSAALSSSVTIDGETYTLASFGIATQSYFTASEEERGTFHIDGNTADSLTSGKTDKLMTAIANDPDTVIEFFQKLSLNMYSSLTTKMASSSLNSAFTIYNDKEMSSQYSTYTDKISEWEDKLADYEDFYYSKFSKMETALSKLQSQTSALSSLLGG